MKMENEQGMDSQQMQETVKPQFAIGSVVEQLQSTYPDVTSSSLRFLEREGLATPGRTSGGHRLYSLNDIDRIRRIKDWQLQGLTLEQVRGRLVEFDNLPIPREIVGRFLERAFLRDLDSVVQMILDADEAGLPLVTTFGEILQPVLVEIGESWHRGEIVVAQEREISEAIEELIAELSYRHHTDHGRGPQLLAACVEGEQHELGLKMVIGLLREQGTSVRYLGPDIAARFLVEAIALERPTAVLLSATLPLNLQSLRVTIEFLLASPEAQHLLPIVVGGQMAVQEPERIRQWGGIPIPDKDINELIDLVANVVSFESGEHTE